MAELPDSTPEPSVLDWLKSLFKLKPLAIPERAAASPVVELRSFAAQPAARMEFRLASVRWRIPLALLIAFVAQILFESRRGEPWLGVALYFCAAGLTYWSWRAKDLAFQYPSTSHRRTSQTAIRIPHLVVGFMFAGLTFLTAAGNQFRLSTVIFWIAAVLLTLVAFWDGEFPLVPLGSRLRAWIRDPGLAVSLNSWRLALLLVFAFAAYFRLYKLNDVPSEMWSDHAEKLLDVVDINDGQYSIFFPRNTGREPLQFYLSAAMA
ncbi:MAG: hypothetical protein ACRDHG_11720, partial [Anaerolineales bacterium]